jgi:protein-S-isoprenylcysteine O-methyltransferase Ste14
MGWRIAVSILSLFGAIIGVILWLFFYAGNFNVYQNIAIIIVILLAFVGITGAVWAPWGMRQSQWWGDKGASSVAPASRETTGSVWLGRYVAHDRGSCSEWITHPKTICI